MLNIFLALFPSFFCLNHIKVCIHEYNKVLNLITIVDTLTNLTNTNDILYLWALTSLTENLCQRYNKNEIEVYQLDFEG
jgi:hypothetical protein